MPAKRYRERRDAAARTRARCRRRGVALRPKPATPERATSRASGPPRTTVSPQPSYHCKRRKLHDLRVLVHLTLQFLGRGKRALVAHETQVADREFLAVGRGAEVAQPRLDDALAPGTEGRLAAHREQPAVVAAVGR